MATRPCRPKWSTVPRPLSPEHAGGMGIVDEDGRPVLFRRLHDPGQRADVTVHAEDAVRDDEDESVGLTRVGPDLGRPPDPGLAQGHDVLVRVHLARRLREAHAVDDRGVVEGVADDEVGLAGDDGMTPVLAVKPDWKTSAASVPLKSASSRSSCSWRESVPAMVRTAPEPTPKSRTACVGSLAQSRVVVRPR